MTTQILTQERLRSLLDYDLETGVFTRRVKIKNQPAGTAVGTSDARGYLHCSIDSKLHKLHRLAWLYVYGVWPEGQIDHINHNPSDNRIANLRDVTCAQNHQNRNRSTNSASGHLGVTWHKRDQCWQAHIGVNGKSLHLGQFRDLTDAINARKCAEQQHHPHRPN